MPRRRGWPPPRWARVLAIAAVAIGGLLLLFDWDWFKGPIERRVSAATGREFAIGGDLDVDLGRIVRIRVEEVRLGSP